MTFHYITLFILNFNHLPYSAPGWAATALPAAGIVLLFVAFLLEIVHRRASALPR